MNKYDNVPLSADSPSAVKVERVDVQPVAKLHDVLTPPAEKTSSELIRVCGYIILNEFGERLCYYSILGSLALYMTRELQINTEDTDLYVNIFSSLVYLTPLLGGYVADAVYGRYTTILIFIIIYAIGSCTLSYATFVHEYSSSSSSRGVFVTGLLIVALGSGGIKPNVSTLGADQLQSANCTQQQIDRYFNYFYMSINVGAIVAYTLVAYICQNVSFTLGYAIPAVSIMLACLVFVAGRKQYVHVPPSGSMLSLLFGIMYYSFTLRHNRHNHNQSIDSYDSDMHDHIDQTPQQSHFTDVCRRSQGGPYTDEQVQDIQYLFRLMPFIALFILYWGIYAQMTTTFFNQGCQMNLTVAGIQFPIAALNLFDAGIIIIFVPLFDLYVYPCLQNVLHIKLTTLRKIGAGFVVVALSMACAAIVEMERLKRAQRGEFAGHSICTQDNGDGISMAVDMSIMWQIPQFMLVGLSEVLASATSLELFYTEAPQSMKSLCSAFSLITTSLGSIVVALMVPLVNSGNNPWITHDANQGHLDYYWWLLCGLMMANALAFIYIAMRYTYKADLDSQLSQKQSEVELTPSGLHVASFDMSD